MILDGIMESSRFNFGELKSKLEFRFGKGNLIQVYYSQFTCRKQKFDEDLVTLGADLERLARLTYLESSFEMQDKIAQFISSIFNRYLKGYISV